MPKYWLLFLFLFYTNIAKSNFLFLVESCELSNEQNQKIYNLTKASYSGPEQLSALKKHINSLDCKNLELYHLVMSGEVYFSKGNSKKGQLKEVYLKLYAYAKEHNDEVAYELGQYEEMSYWSSVQQFDKAIEIGINFVQKRPNSLILPFVMKKTGRLFGKKGDKETALRYFKKAFDLALETDNLYFKVKIYSDYLEYLDGNHPPELEIQGEKLLSIPTKYPWDRREVQIRFGLETTKGKQKLKEKEYAKALSFFTKARSIAGDSQYYKNQANFYIFTSYVKQGDYINAERIVERIPLQQILFQNYYRQFLELSIETYRALKKYDKVDKYAELYIAYQKSAFDKEQNRLIADVNEKYQTAEKDKQLLIQKAANQIYLFALLFSFLVVVFMIWMYFRNQKYVKKELRLKQQRTKELEELDTLKSNFFAQLAHEFRTPLTLIKSPIELMKAGDLKGNKKQYYEVILRNTEHLLGLVNQMLIFSKIDMHKMQLEKTKGDVILFVKKTVNQFESLAKSKNIDFLLYLPKEPCFVLFDKLTIERILLNVLHNAIKYTPSGGKIAVSLSTTESRWVVKIEDTGIGIKKDDLETIFDSFYRTDQDVVKTEAGFGLGLHIVKELSSLHNGSVHVESQLGKGTIFTLQFEVEENEQLSVLNWIEKPNLITAPESSIKPALVTRPLNIDQRAASNLPVLLIVEDNHDLQQLFTDQLSGDYQIQSAYNGLEALKMIEQNIPDIILSDVMMPKMNGIELATKIRTNVLSSHIPLLLLTALDVEKIEYQGLIAGATDYLTKPVNFKILKLKLQNQLSILKNSQNQVLKNVILSATKQSVVANENEDYIPKADNFIKVLGHLDAAFLKDIQNILKDNLNNDQFSVEYLSEKMNISRSNLFLKVKALTGLSTSAFIRKYRLNLAKKIISEGRGNVSEAAFKVGITNVSYFCRVFKEEFGVSPKNSLNAQSRI